MLTEREFHEERRELYEKMPENVKEAMNTVTEYFGYGDINNMALAFSILENANFHTVAGKMIEFWLERRNSR